jgi:hypothetical protein
MAVTERTGAITKRILNIRALLTQHGTREQSLLMPEDNVWGHLSKRDIARIQEGRLTGVKALETWARANGKMRMDPEHPFLPIVFAVCPQAEQSMNRILKDPFQEQKAHTTAALELERSSDSGKITAVIRKIIRDRQIGEGNMLYFRETSVEFFGGFTCKDAPKSRRERFANGVRHVVFSGR